MRLQKLPRSFYLRPTLKVAEELLGCFLVRKSKNQKLVGCIVEVEAYLGAEDPASHAFKGLTKRNEVMFWSGGHLYVYFTYGMHFCANVVTEEEGTAHAVLLRAAQPVAGVEEMRTNRNMSQTSPPNIICGGPARLCQAFGINRKDNGTDLCGNTIWIARNINQAERPPVARSTRVGISEGKGFRWRFFIKDSPFVSPGKPV